MEAVTCKLCREPIQNFICVNCLAKNIKAWLPREFSCKFSMFHSDISRHFTDFYEAEPCIRCKHENHSVICPYCYIKEVYQWLKDENQNLADKFINTFPLIYVFRKKGKKFQPLLETKNGESESGVCDICGEYSDKIERSDSGWVCEYCKQEEEG